MQPPACKDRWDIGEMVKYGQVKEPATLGTSKRPVDCEVNLVVIVAASTEDGEDHSARAP